jgi:serine/threonine protein kinase
MGVLKLIRHKAASFYERLEAEVRKAEGTVPEKEIPEDARYEIGETIHLAGCGIPLDDLKVLDIKAGGYAIVYLVETTSDRTRYALKTFQDWCLDGDYEVKRFMREAESWIRLGKHPNIVYAHSVFNMHGRPFILLEYVDSLDLWDRMRGRRIPTPQALKYSIQLCRGMSHARKVIPDFVHRDLKPSNCLIDSNGVLKIADFGQVKVSDEAADRVRVKETARRSGQRTDPFNTPADHWGGGTPSYMSPEQFDPATGIDVRSDVYSFGCMLFEMLTGTRLVNVDDHEESRREHLRRVPPDPVSLNREIPRSLANLILSCLAKTPQQRPRNFEILEKELIEILASVYQEEHPRSQTSTELSVANIAHRGTAFAALGRYDTALACFDRLIESDSDFPLAWNYKGQTLATLGREQEALGCFDCALRLDEQLDLAWINKGISLSKLGRFEEALTCFERAIAIDGSSALAWRERANALAKTGNPDMAWISIKRSLALDHRQPETHDMQGLAYQNLARHCDAIESFEQSIRLDPTCAETHNNLGKAYASLGQVSQAIRAYERATEIKAGYAEAHFNLGNAYRELNPAGNARVGETYAELVLSFLLDYSLHLKPGEPVFVLELGSRSAGLALSFMKTLTEKLQYFSHLEALKIRYIMTDFLEERIKRIEMDDRLQALRGAGAIDFAVYRPEQDGRLFLRNSQTELRTETTGNPIMVIANDFFQSLKADLFRTRDKQLQVAGFADTTAGQTCGRESFQAPLAYRNVDSTYFTNPGFRAVLDYCHSSAGSREFLFPTGALSCIEGLRTLSHDNLVILSTDCIGTAADAEIGHLEQSYVVQDSLFVNRTNYEAINRYNENQEGLTLYVRDQGDNRAIAMNILVPSADCKFEQTRYRFQQEAERLCLAIQLREAEFDQETQGSERASVWGYLSMLDLSNYDPEVFCQRSEQLYDLVKQTDDARIKRLLKAALSQVQDNLPAAVRERETCLWLGKIYYRLHLYDECVEIFERSIKLSGADSNALYYLGACNEVREEYETALGYYKQALKLDSTFELSAEAVKRMEGMLSENKTLFSTSFGHQN